VTGPVPTPEFEPTGGPGAQVALTNIAMDSTAQALPAANRFGDLNTGILIRSPKALVDSNKAPRLRKPKMPRAGLIGVWMIQAAITK
jgi:hypothetical protein